MPSLRTVLLATCTLVLTASTVSADPVGSPNRLVRVRRRVDEGLGNVATANDGTNKNTLHLGIGWMQRDLSDAESPADELARTEGMKVAEPATVEPEAPIDSSSEPEASEMSASSTFAPSAAPAIKPSPESFLNTSANDVHPTSFSPIEADQRSATFRVAPLERQDSTPGDALKVAKEIKRLGAIQKHALPDESS